MSDHDAGNGLPGDKRNTYGNGVCYINIAEFDKSRRKSIQEEIMGGWGSGRRGWNTKDGRTRPIVEWMPAVDPTYFAQVLKVLNEGERTIRLTWCHEDFMEDADCWIKREGDEAKIWVGQTRMKATRKPLTKNGHRWWLTCPHCNQARSRLYSTERLRVFGCRKCYGFTYASQRKEPPNPSDRMFPHLAGERWERPCWNPYLLDDPLNRAVLGDDDCRGD